MATDLLSLPQELQIRILSHLDAISLTRCAMTCKSMHKSMQKTSQLLYTIQLHFAGLKDAGTSTARSELIEQLQHYRDAWLSPNTIDVRKYAAIDMKYEFPRYKIVGGALSETNRRHVEIVSLPTSSNKESCTSRSIDSGMHFRHFAMDPTQDVIAYLEDDGDTNPTPRTAPRIFRIHIRTISTNAPHQRALQNPLWISLPPSYHSVGGTHVVEMYFAHHALGFYLSTFEEECPHIQIWDWMTSDVIVDFARPFDDSLPAARYEFGVLDSTSYFITSILGSGSIRLYKLIPSPSPSKSTTHARIHVATLHLPHRSDKHIQMHRLSCDANPIAANPLPDAPFMLNPDDRLHAFLFLYSDRAGRFEDHAVLNLFVHQRVFMKYCRQGAADGDRPREIPWEDWGPMNTRLIWPSKIQRQQFSHRSIHGQRVIWSQPPPDTIETYPKRPPNTIQVLDFSLAAISSEDAVSPASPSLNKGKRIALVDPSMIPDGQRSIFKHDVETRLPYVCTEWNLQNAYGMHMIYEHGVIGVEITGNKADILHVYPV